MKTFLKIKKIPFLLLVVLGLISINRVWADETKTAEIKLSFHAQDSLKTCHALVMSEGKPLANVAVKFYAKRLYSLLPLGGDITTGEDGIASLDFPKDLPGDEKDNIIVIAKIEDDEHVANCQSQATINWGVKIKNNDHWNSRSLSAARDKAPTVLIIVSNIIITVIWGVIAYVVVQVFRIRKSSSRIKNKTITN